jgi:hypothetical protein
MSTKVATVTKCFSRFTAKCVVDFYLDWLDELIDRRDYEGLSIFIFGHVAAGLYRVADARSVPFIVDGQHPFPVPRGDAEWPDRKQIDPQEFAASIASRILDLEGREAPPKGLPHAIRAFGFDAQNSKRGNSTHAVATAHPAYHVWAPAGLAVKGRDFNFVAQPSRRISLEHQWFALWKSISCLCIRGLPH